MSTTVPETPTEQTPSPEEPRVHYREVGFLIQRRAATLQAGRHRSAVVATLARLRANAGKEPGTDPAIWSQTVDGVPGTPWGDGPTVQEWAVHTAMTLFATHQQSRDAGMHRPGVGLGQAVARLERKQGGAEDDRISSLRRRFDAAVTAATPDELAHHLRGLVTQLRGGDEGLDYGLLADDLVQFQQPGQAGDVRRRWARQLYHLDPRPDPRQDRDAAAAGDIPAPPTEEQQ
ncbi:type I-E CRISPR-associated protein Cse2/CasB [Xylanimonas protaetiae]|uniref:Type I-E CRISPR-associated protein Cse2/CasB n=1 Tax=Xylanimonas protaetiae TaxID=2509457 RepID=A0A4P6F913_9MICO|nr:type I-E CRISPR-associated protein Cse2/CasB [Xylanimonas protaetiae]QAY71393.1 type I-E CRISPR-associated protein Cse2/CasB [Xylanimonas protaetiae]